MFIDLWLFLGAMLVAGGVGGLLAGMLGVGGGIVIVPILEVMLGLAGIDSDIRMHIAVATSLATIIMTSLASTRAHARHDAVDWGLTRRWGVWVFLGAIAGTVFATRLHSAVLAGIFAVIGLLVAARMIVPVREQSLASEVPDGATALSVPVTIGALSAMIGIGGGTLMVPVLSRSRLGIHKAVGTSALFGLMISVPATVGYIIAGYGDDRLPPGSLGFVNLLGFVCIVPAAWLFAPWGARLAHRLRPGHLAKAFGIFLLIVSCRMFYRAFSG